jgi:hypothetical protein
MFNQNSIELHSIVLPTKKEIEQYADSVTQQVLDGNLSPIEIHCKAKAIIKMMELIIAETEASVVDEIQIFGHNNELDFGNATAKLRDSFATPNYESDPTYCALKLKLKERELLLKLAFQNPSVECTDTNGGEIVPVVSAKITKQSIAITFKK